MAGILAIVPQIYFSLFFIGNSILSNFKGIWASKGAESGASQSLDEYELVQPCYFSLLCLPC